MPPKTRRRAGARHKQEPLAQEPPQPLLDPKQVHRRRHGMEAAVPTPITGSTQTRHAPGNAVKADAISIEVGGKQLLEDANLMISGDVKTYGLVGPNGCGKTTLLRLLSGTSASDFSIPLPAKWGQPYLVDQLDPDPTGLSPLEEVLSSNKERSKLLTEQAKLTKQLEDLAGNDVDADAMQDLCQQMQDVDRELSMFGAEKQKVIHILVGLGFHHGETPADDGAPSLHTKDELITTSNAIIGDVVEVRDEGDEEWLRGCITSIDPLEVCPIDWSQSFGWESVRHVNELSGGWRKKVQLAKALYDQPRFLLLDEPTNHLDFHARLYLEEQLKSYGEPVGAPKREATVLIVSHDPCFLQEVCGQAMQIVDRKLQTHPMKELSLAGLAAIQSDTKVKKEKWRFAYPASDRPENHALSLNGVRFQYPSQAAPVFDNIHKLVFNGRSRSVVVGRNGSGKTTLLKLCLRKVQPTHGEVSDATCKVRHFSQFFHKELDEHPELSAVSYLVQYCADHLKMICDSSDEDKLRERAGIVLKRFGLARQQAWDMSVAQLSGGQKARVNFAFLSLCPAHLLILDEPTNHLDADGLQHLADALEAFEGGVVVISHNELLIQRILSSSDRSELFICRDGCVHQRESMQGFTQYRREATTEQFLRAQAAVEATKGPQEGLKSEPPTREPSPEPVREPSPDSKPVKTLADVLKKSKRKPRPVSTT